MKIIYNKFIPVKGYTAINLFGVLFARKGETVDKRLINHEEIHTAQMKELLYVFFYILYVAEWIFRLVQFGRSAYENISFERESHDNQSDYGYLKTREKYSWIKYIKNKQNESKS